MGTSEVRDTGLNDRASRRRQRAIEAEGAVVRSEVVPDDPGVLARYGLGFITLLLIALPLLFGGVHATVYGPVEIGIFTLLTCLVVGARSAVMAPFGSDTVYRATFVATALLLSYLFARGLADLFISTAPHPVLGSGVQLAAIRDVTAWLREVLVVVAAVVVVRTILALHPRAFRRITNVVVGVGVLTAMIGLAHWFYDNGRLFWLFEPDNVFVSQRARWPFVNSNHLACFLLPAFFLLIGRCGDESAALRNAMISQRTGRPKSIADLSGDERFQRKIVRLTLTMVLVMAVLLCIIATLSRGVWFGALVGGLTFLVLDRVSRPGEKRSVARAVEASGAEPRSQHHHSRRRRRSARIPFAPSTEALRRIRVLVVALFCLAVYIFLRDRGAELVESRIEYGLLHSKDDMRFQLLADTWPLIVSHPWFGLGLDRWASAYATVMSPLLAGIEPVYLHNEPAQLLAETGIIGLLLAVGCLGVLFFKGCRRLTISRDRFTHISLLAAFIATMVVTVFDFHLRMPAIVFQLAVVIALIIDLGDGTPRKGVATESLGVERSS